MMQHNFPKINEQITNSKHLAADESFHYSYSRSSFFLKQII